MRTAEAIELNEDERAYVQTWVHRGHAAARIQTRARIVLKLAEGWRDVEIARALEVGVGTVSNTRQRFLAGGLEAVLHDKTQERRRQALSGAQLAHLIAIACSPAPQGHDQWTLRLLAGQAVELGFVPSISPETIRQALKKTSSSPGSMSTGACRPSGRRSSPRWKRSSTSTRSRPIPGTRSSVSTRSR
jgi:transposase